MDGLRAYLLRLAAAALLTSLAAAVTPEGTVRKVVVFIGGLIMTLTLLAPISGLEPPNLSRYLAELQLEYNESVSGVEVKSSELKAQIISEQAGAYILTKAGELGLTLEVQVETKLEGYYPYPWAVTLTGTAADMQREVLTKFIETNLAIPAQRQTWRST